MIRKRECGDYLIVFQDAPPNGYVHLVSRTGLLVLSREVGFYGIDPLDWGESLLKEHLEWCERREELAEAQAAWGRLHADS